MTVRSNYRFYDIGADPVNPPLVATYLPRVSGAQLPHEFFLWDDPQRPNRAFLFQTTPTSSRESNNMLIADISRAREGAFPEFVWRGAEFPAEPQRDNRLHSFGVSNDGTRAYLAYLGGGFLIADTSDFAADVPNPEVRQITPTERRPHWGDPGAHSAVKVPGRDFALITDEVYGEFLGVLARSGHGCPWGWVRMIGIGDETAPGIAAEYRVFPHNDPGYCPSSSFGERNFSSQSAHNPTLTPNLGLVTWHGRGLQAIDISNPAAPRQAAEFIPTPLPSVETEDPALSQAEVKVVAWSYPIVKDGLVYITDVRNGLYILRYRGPFENEVSSTRFLEGNSNLGDALRFEPPGAVRAARRSINLSVRPARVRAGRRVRFRFEVTSGTGVARQASRGATVRFAGRRVRTNGSGRAVMRVRFRTPGRRRARATLTGFRGDTATVRVVGAQVPRFTG
jgi:hypothetical protein